MASGALRPLLVVISGPSGVGKDAVIAQMKATAGQRYYAVTATTRPMRAGEEEGVDYHFFSRARFEKMVAAGEFLEWANVYGHFYGVPRKPVLAALAEGGDAVVKVDVQGAATIKASMPSAVTIFISPPSVEELQRRLRGRKTESASQLAVRLKVAQDEMQKAALFDYVVVSERDKIALAVDEIEAIIAAEKLRRRSAAIEP